MKDEGFANLAHEAQQQFEEERREERELIARYLEHQADLLEFSSFHGEHELMESAAREIRDGAHLKDDGK